MGNRHLGRASPRDLQPQRHPPRRGARAVGWSAVPDARPAHELIGRSRPHQSQRSANESFRLIGPISLIIGDEGLWIRSCFEFCLDPAGVEQQCVQPRTFLRRSEVIGKIKIEVTSGRRIRRRSRDVGESRRELSVLCNLPLLPRLILQELMHRVVQSKDPLSMVETVKEDRPPARQCPARPRGFPSQASFAAWRRTPRRPFANRK